jgi:glycerol-3-phosphate acyltransferase PlsY
MLGAVLLLAFAYVCGSIPTGVLLSGLRGLDPRDIGSGNIGATNVARTAGPAFGALTLLGDLAKGLLPVWIATRAGFGEGVAALAGLAAFVGHVFSCFLRFSGGKGVTTALGVLLALAPGAMAFVVPIFLLIVGVSRYVSLGSMVVAAATPPIVFALGYGPAIVAVALAMSALILVRHRDNIQRIRFGTEPRLGSNRATPSDSGVA